MPVVYQRSIIQSRDSIAIYLLDSIPLDKGCTSIEIEVLQELKKVFKSVEL